MALVVEAVGPTGAVERIALDGGTAVVKARPGLTYRILDETGRALDASATVRRLGDDLAIEGLPDDATVRLADFFLACTPSDPCSLDLEGLGGARGETISPLSEPIAALADGSFVLHAPESMATPTAPESEFSAKPALGGLALLALAGGGGGGGGGGSGDASPPGPPTITSAALTNDPTPVFTGTATPGSQVTLTLTVPGSGPFSFVAQADENGNWVIDTGAQAPAAGVMPPGGLPGDAITTGLLLAQSSGGTSGDPVAFQITVDLAPPVAVATLVAVTDDVPDVTGPLADGSLSNDPTPTLSGTLSQALDAGEVTRILRDGVPIGTATVTGTQWVFTDTGLADGATHVYSARVEDAVGNTSTPSADFTLRTDFTAPAMPTIAGPIAGDDIINEAEGRIANPSPITIGGTAEAGTLVRVSWDLVVVETTVADDGTWSAVFNAQEIPDGDYVIRVTSHDTAGNSSEAASIAVRVLTGKPSAPSFLPVEGDDLVSAADGLDGITLAGGMTAGSTVFVTVDGIEYQATSNGNQWQLVLPPGTLDDGTYTASAVARDIAGNLSVTGSSAPFIVDVTPPTQLVAITGAVDNVAEGTGTIASGGLSNDDTPTIQGTVSSGLAAGEVLQVFRDGTLVGNATVSGTNWSFPDNLANAQGNHGYSARVVDAAGNEGAMSAGFDLVLDTVRPAAPSIAAVATDDFVDTFEAAAGVAITGGGIESGGSVRVTWGGVTRTGTVDSAGNWSADFESGEIPGDGTYDISATAYDAAGNGSLAQTRQVQVDRTGPSVTITSEATGPVNGTVTFRFTFDEPVSGFAAGDVLLSAGARGEFTGSDGDSVYTLAVTPPAGAAGSFTVGVPAGVAQDLAGNPNTAAAPVSQQYDREAPTPTIELPGGTATGPFAVTIRFAEAVTGFSPADVRINGEPADGPFSDGNGTTTFVLQVTPDNDTTGNVSISVPAGVATDAAGNPSLAAPAQVQAFDTVTPPGVAITGDTGGTANGDVTFTFTFTEPVNGFTAGDVQLSAGTPGTFTGSDGDSVYTLVVTPPAGAAGSFTVGVPADVAQDLAGNPNTAASTVSQEYDREAPTPTIELPGGTATGPFAVTIRFAEAVTGFLADEVEVSGGTAATAFSGGNGTTTFVLQVTPDNDTTGNVSISVPAGVATDAAGNPSLAAPAQVQAFDTVTPPGVAITGDTGGTANGDVTFTFTFTEPVNGFTAGDVQLSAGTRGAFTGSDGDSVYTLVVTPPAGEAGSFTVDVQAGVAQDLAGNPNTAAVPVSQQYDRQAPTLTVGDLTPDAIASGPVTFTFVFSEPVFGFDSTDIDVSGGSKGTFGGNAGDSSYTLVIDPDPDASGTLSVWVEENVATDAASNGNQRGDPYPSEQAYDTSRTLTIDVLLDDTGSETGPVSNGGTADDPTPTLTISLSGGTLQAGESILLLRDDVEVDSTSSPAASWNLEDFLDADGTYVYTAQLVSGGSPLETSNLWTYTLLSLP